jgi:hypothetical protein
LLTSIGHFYLGAEIMAAAKKVVARWFKRWQKSRSWLTPAAHFGKKDCRAKKPKRKIGVASALECS